MTKLEYFEKNKLNLNSLKDKIKKVAQLINAMYEAYTNRNQNTYAALNTDLHKLLNEYIKD